MVVQVVFRLDEVLVLLYDLILMLLLDLLLVKNGILLRCLERVPMSNWFLVLERGFP